MKGLITAGGRGTRMQPLTFSTNKHLIPLAGKPLIFYAIEGMVGAGIKKIGVNYNPGQLEELKAALLPEEKKYGVKFSFILQEKPAGLANIVQVSEKFIGKDKVVMHLGDNIFYGGIAPLVKKFSQSEANALLILIRHSENSRMAVPYFDRKGNLKKIVEKPENPPYDWAVPGLYFFDQNAFKCFKGKDKIKPSARGEYEIVSIYNWLLRKGYQVEKEEFAGAWHDPGKFDDWLATNQFLLDEELKEEKPKQRKGARIEGRVRIGKRCRLENSILRGPIIIADRVVIKNSFIGPYSSISSHCQINGARLENSILMEGVTINSPGKALDSCVIGRGTMIEGNSKILDQIELFVGNQCLIKF